MNVVCTDPERDIGDECFCLCADTGPAAREHFDLQLMDLGGRVHGRGGHAGGRGVLREPDVQARRSGARGASAARS